MYQIGDYIVYGSNGVCVVDDIGSMDVPGIPKDRVYYTLRPCYLKGSTIFTPADNQKVIMRPILTREEALALVDEIGDIECLWVADEKKREQLYKEAVGTCECRELVKIIKTIYQRQQERLAEGKKITFRDEKYFSMAEDNLYGELALSLGMDKDEVKDFITERYDQEQNALA